jgi:hypothetical protein
MLFSVLRREQRSMLWYVSITLHVFNDQSLVRLWSSVHCVAESRDDLMVHDMSGNIAWLSGVWPA